MLMFRRGFVDSRQSPGPAGNSCEMARMDPSLHMRRPRVASGGGGRSRIRTWEGVADGFTGSPSLPIGCPLTCGYSIPRRVKAAFCPRGVRSFGVCLVSATQVVDHVP
jgi:hypothetical protein